jgi:hypothetical protein
MPEAEDAEAAEAIKVVVSIVVEDDAALSVALDRFEAHELDEPGQGGVYMLGKLL